MIKSYKKVPVTIQALQWTGNNQREVIEFCKGHAKVSSSGSIVIDTLEGTLTASKGDFIIRGVDGEFYPCKPDIFNKTYTEV